jgi:hypothetical protein
MSNWELLRVIVGVFALVVVGVLVVQLITAVVGTMSRALEWSTGVYEEYAPVAVRASYLGLSVAVAGAILWLYVGSLWPVPVLVFVLTTTGVVRRVLPASRKN